MFRSYWFIVVAFGLALASIALAQEQPPEQPVEPSQAQEQTDEQPAIKTDSAAPAIAPTEPPSAEHDSPSTKYATKDTGNDVYLLFGDGWAQWIMAVTGLAAFILSAWAVWLLKATLKATRDAVNEAAKANASADSAVEITQRIGEAQTKAYIGIKHCVILIENGRATATLSVVNSGQTPGHLVSFDYALKFVDSDKDMRHLVAPIPAFIKHGEGLVFEDPIRANMHFPAGAEVRPYRGLEISESQLKRLESGDAHLVMTGDMEYTDVFKRVWFTRFQFVTGGRFPFVRDGKMFASKYNMSEILKSK